MLKWAYMGSKKRTPTGEVDADSTPDKIAICKALSGEVLGICADIVKNDDTGELNKRMDLFNANM